MNAEVIEPKGDLQREVWRFSLMVGGGYPTLYFDYFGFQTRKTKRHKWKPQTHWGRIMRSGNSIARPEPPPHIINQAKSIIKERIDALPIT